MSKTSNETDRLAIEKRISYLEGYITAVSEYAIWRNGERLVGCLETPLDQAIKKEKDELDRLYASEYIMK